MAESVSSCQSLSWLLLGGWESVSERGEADEKDAASLLSELLELMRTAAAAIVAGDSTSDARAANGSVATVLAESAAAVGCASTSAVHCGCCRNERIQRSSAAACAYGAAAVGLVTDERAGEVGAVGSCCSVAPSTLFSEMPAAAVARLARGTVSADVYSSAAAAEEEAALGAADAREEFTAAAAAARRARAFARA